MSVGFLIVDEVMTTALLDRLLHRSHVLNIRRSIGETSCEVVTSGNVRTVE
jgi:hypothetical protein